jgi:hypothetical protein
VLLVEVVLHSVEALVHLQEELLELAECTTFLGLQLRERPLEV